MSLYEHVRSPLETRRKMLEMNMKTAELKRAFSEYFLAKNGDAYVSMQLMDSVWSVVEKVMEVAAKNGYLLESDTEVFKICFACLERLQTLVPETDE